MKSTDAVAVALVTADGVLDKMALDTTKLDATDRAFCTEYKTVLGSGDTSRQQDAHFKYVFDKFMGKLKY